MDAKQKYKLFRKSKHFCTAPWNLLYVGVNGNIKSCTNGYTIGHLQEHNITEILSNKNYKLLRKIFIHKIFLFSLICVSFLNMFKFFNKLIPKNK